MKKRSTKLKWIGLTLASLGAVVSGSVMADGHHAAHVETHGGLKVVNCEDYWFAIGGRLNFDETVFSGGTQDKRSDFPNGGNLRRALLKLTGGVGESMSYNLTLDLSGANGDPVNNGNTVDFHDAYINFTGCEAGPIGRTNLRLGQFSAPISIDALGNNGTKNDNVFLESALATQAFSIPEKVYGVWADASALDMFVLSASAFQPRVKNSVSAAGGVNNNNYGDPGRSDRLGGAIRLTFSPVHEDCTVYHVGVVGRYQSMNNNLAGNPVTQANLFAAQPEARARNTAALVNSGAIRARSYNTVTAEVLGLWGPAFVSGEYTQANVQRVPTITVAESRDNPRFNGWHVQGGYMLTGEARKYEFHEGSLRNPHPQTDCGAWEVVARFSYLNLVNKNIYGGSEHNTTLGVNWFVNQHVHLALNWIRANIRQTNAATPGTPQVALAANTKFKRQLDIVGLRFGVSF